MINTNSVGRAIAYTDTLDGKPTLFIEPQAIVGDYRVDFLLTPTASGLTGRKIVVECDGHDFHERTKEQAERDRSRDRGLTAGHTVLRFTGSEIYRNPRACAAQIETFVRGEILVLSNG